MKKMLRLLLFSAALAVMLSVGAFAHTYYVPTNSTASISNYSTEKFDVTATSNVTNDSQYLVLVLNEKAAPTEDNIVYINQEAAAENKVTFENVYPKEMLESPDRASETNTYYVYVVGEGRTFNASAPAATFKYYEADVLLGDANSDHSVNSTDAVWILRYRAGLLTESQLANQFNVQAGDVNNSSQTDSTDAVWILQRAANLRDESFVYRTN